VHIIEGKGKIERKGVQKLLGFCFFNIDVQLDHLCGPVVRVPGYRSKGPDLIPGATRFVEKWVWNGVHSAL
jgi:hypothetical protein